MAVQEEMKKRRPTAPLISKNMDSTFALRRKELVNLEPPVKNTVEKWPALFTEGQILAEFCRLSSKNLQAEFFKELDKYTPRFLEIFKSKGGSVGQILQEYLQQVNPGSTDVTGKRTAVLRGLPVILGDENADFYKTCFDSDDLPDMSHTSLGILTVIAEDTVASPHSLHLESMATAIVLEGTLVMDDLDNLPHAMCLLFGLIYALNLEYPQQLRNTFEFIQRVLLSLGPKTLKSTDAVVTVFMIVFATVFAMFMACLPERILSPWGTAPVCSAGRFENFPRYFLSRTRTCGKRRSWTLPVRFPSSPPSGQRGSGICSESGQQTCCRLQLSG